MTVRERAAVDQRAQGELVVASFFALSFHLARTVAPAPPLGLAFRASEGLLPSDGATVSACRYAIRTAPRLNGSEVLAKYLDWQVG